MIRDFMGDTFVSFIDLSGFKKMMEDEERAIKALDLFYKAGYKSLKNQKSSYPLVKGFLFSDCIILFARTIQNKRDFIKELKKVLDIIKEINSKLIVNNIMFKTSIAYGTFRYQTRTALPNRLDKEFIYGLPYVKAYLDTEITKPKMRPGECRILREGLPDGLSDNIQMVNNSPFNHFSERLDDHQHYYYYWMCERNDSIIRYKEEYENFYDPNDPNQDQMYQRIADLIKRYSFP